MNPYHREEPVVTVSQQPGADLTKAVEAAAIKARAKVNPKLDEDIEYLTATLVVASLASARDPQNATKDDRAQAICDLIEALYERQAAAAAELERQRDEARAVTERLQSLHRGIELVAGLYSCAECSRVAGEHYPWPCMTSAALAAPVIGEQLRALADRKRASAAVEIGITETLRLLGDITEGETP